MRISQKVQKTVNETTDILCNLCGVSCKVEIGKDITEFKGLIEVQVVGGYCSKPIEDGDVHKFSLCESCVVNLTKTFKHPSFQGNYWDNPTLLPSNGIEILGAEGSEYLETFSDIHSSAGIPKKDKKLN